MKRKVSKSKNTGREIWNVNFYHPLIIDEKTGNEVRVRRSTYTENEKEVEKIIEDLERLINDINFHNIIRISDAHELGLHSSAIEIFFSDIEVKSDEGHELIRNMKIPMISENKVIDIVGFSGAGKTTLLAQLLGLDLKNELVLATSTNKTTVAGTEFIINNTDTFSLVCTFKEKQIIEGFVRELVQRAILESIQNDDYDAIIRKFTESSDKEFRLHYLLGTIKNNDTNISLLTERFSKFQENTNIEPNSNGILTSILENLISSSRQHWEEYVHHKGLKTIELTDTEKIEFETQFVDEFVNDDNNLEHVNQIMKEIERTVNRVLSTENINTDKNKSGWINYVYANGLNRETCLSLIEKLSTNKKKLFGSILTPLVASLRVSGPFYPDWVDKQNHKFTFVDGRGLDHSLKETFSVIPEINKKLQRADKILLVIRGSETLSHNAKIFFENIEISGFTTKTQLAFTHFDELNGENFMSPTDKANHIASNLEQVLNLLEIEKKNNLQRNLIGRMFFMGHLNRNLDIEVSDHQITLNELNSLTTTLNMTKVELHLNKLDFVYYRHLLPIDLLDFAEQFNYRWNSLLGLRKSEGIDGLPWPTIKALSRRYAELNSLSFSGISPTGDMEKYMKDCLYKYFSAPNYFSNEQLIDEAKLSEFRNEAMEVAGILISNFSRKRVLDDSAQLTRWKRAYYERRGSGSTSRRAHDIVEIIENAIPLFNPTTNNKEFKVYVNLFISNVIEEVIETLNRKYEAKIILK